MKYFISIIMFCLLFTPIAESQSSVRLEAMEFIKQGDNFLRMGNWTDALAAYTNAVVSDPGFADAYMKRAMLNKRIGANKEADDDYNRAIAINPHSIYIYDQRFKLDLLAIEYFAHDQKQSLHDNTSPIQIDHEADYYINFNAYENALVLIDSLIGMGFEKEFELEKKALIYFLNDDFISCEKYADSALVISKNSALPHDLKGLSLLKRGACNEAVVAFSKAIEIDPLFSVAYLNRAIAHMRCGKNEEALNDLQTSIEMNQKVASSYYLQGVLLGQKGDIKRSLESYDNALAEDNYYTKALFNRSFTWKMMGDFTKAMDDANTIVELQPESPEYWNLKGNMHMLYADYYEAITSYDNAIMLKPDYAEAYYNRGLAFLMSYTPKRGCEDLNESKRLGYNRAAEAILNFCGR
jgi:tetratricopeptide (TPR) repeat protein